MTTAALGDSGFNTMTGPQIYKNFIEAKGPGRLQEAQSHLSNVMNTYQDRVKQITNLAASMAEGWTGSASEAAQSAAAPLAMAHDEAALRMTQASQLIGDQSQAFYDIKNSVVPVPEAPKTPSTVDNVITLGSANSNYESKVKSYMDAAMRNVTAMRTWSGASADNGSRMPSSYGKLDSGAFKVSMTTPGGAPPVVGGGGHASVPGSGGTPTPVVPHGGGGISTSTAGGGGYRGPNGVPAGAARSTDSAQATTPGGFTGFPGPGPAGGTGGSSSGGLGGGPTPSGPGGAGWAPIGAISGSLPDSGGSTTGYRGSGSGSGPGVGSGAGENGPGRGAAGRLYGGGASGGGAAGEKGLGAGNRVGSGANGMAGQSVVRGGSAGAAGKPGASGMGASGGGRGQGEEEDKEHQRKYVLDDDEFFQLTDEGEKLVDPNTGLPVAPPVIGG